ncbi:HlyD family efflux transporter periplasmic adaptor subunit [Lusitaniella coriacea LEGE 07157]|uniref:HlyD family efflux transporter periplasmic adaptor subunit n=1 Tax=Lusitaniella coriacea LEGE 07157 TaxID=945747 RepID=A0A8J7DWG9_9CYAN|nr:HlyD family efflux transporter periplasmic adaptor subunit [Lusitaniella coriacea]MBE9116467.1 HlyD family efflux transporter periplasmic adaptor subunit [Lusitaniella coriacea LEGE 07157]
MTQPNGHRPDSNQTTRPSNRGLSYQSTQSLEPQPQTAITTFDQPVVLRQSPMWSRAIVWTIVGIVTFGVGWAFIAKIEQVIPAQGQLEPEGTVKEVQAPLEGVVQAVYVEDGQPVEPGDLLVRFDSTANLAQAESLKKQRADLRQENQLYRSIINQSGSGGSRQALVAQLKLSPQVLALTENRDALIQENRLFSAQLSGGAAADAARLRSQREEAEARRQAANLEVAQIRQRLRQNQIEIADAQVQLRTELDVLERLRSLAEDGAIAQLQYIEQKQKVQTRESQIAQLQQEQQRLNLDIRQGQVETVVTTSTGENETRDRIAANTKRISEINSQLRQEYSQLIVNNEKLISELNSKISAAEQTLKYRELRAKVAGTVFDLKAHAGFVANPTQPLLSIVPNDNLLANVFITNKDIGFVREGMKTDVRIDSFPFSEFGDIKGEVVAIGSDALPPDDVHPFYRFPAKVRLDNQVLIANEREIPLQSGMAISVNIKVREDRRVIGLFLELFTDQIESLKQVR